MNKAIILLLHYGSALLPLSYLVATVFRGRHRRAFLIAIGLHLLASLAVVGIIYFPYYVFCSEWDWAMAYLIPVNLLFGIGYVAILCRPQSAHPDSPHLASMKRWLPAATITLVAFVSIQIVLEIADADRWLNYWQRVGSPMSISPDGPLAAC
jgi:hypothetical protein